MKNKHKHEKFTLVPDQEQIVKERQLFQNQPPEALALHRLAKICMALCIPFTACITCLNTIAGIAVSIFLSGYIPDMVLKAP